MSKPPTVSDFASTLSAVIAPVSKQLPEAIDKPVMIRPDFDTDVLWKPPRLSRSRTVSTESSDSEARRSVSFSEPSPPIFTEMIFGSPNRFSNTRQSPTIAEGSDTPIEGERKRSIVDYLRTDARLFIKSFREIRPRTRRFSFTEMIFGSPNRFSNTRQSPTIAEGSDTPIEGERKRSIVDDERFRDFLRHQKSAFGD
uniref:Uncharacterized protein n=1 Tax=Ascaris lumbricoides TaxID=6252 RepID=A0A0M3IP92_ASCLU